MLLKMFASTQKRRGNENEDQPIAKKLMKSDSYEDFSPSLLRVDTQPYLETIEGELKSTLSYPTTQLDARELPWIDISAKPTKRVRTLITPLGTLKVEFRLFVDDEATDKGVFISEQQWKEFKQHLPKLEFAFSSFLSYGENSAYRAELGNLHYAEFDPKFPCIQLRRYYEDRKTKMERPTRQGITFSMQALQQLKKIIPCIDDAIANASILPSLYRQQ